MTKINRNTGPMPSRAPDVPTKSQAPLKKLMTIVDKVKEAAAHQSFSTMRPDSAKTHNKIFMKIKMAAKNKIPSAAKTIANGLPPTRPKSQ